MNRRIFFALWPVFLLALGAAGPPGPVLEPRVILQGPVGPDIVPGTPYGAYPPGLEPRLPVIPPPSAPPIGAIHYGSSPTETLSGCQAYAQSYQRLDCENGFNRVNPTPVTKLQNNPPIPPNEPSGAAVPAVVPIAPRTPLESRLAPGTITDPRTGQAIPPNRPMP